MSETIGVLGGGSWGTAISSILGDNGYDVLLWTRDGAVAHGIDTTHRNPHYLPEALLAPGVQAVTDLSRLGRECRVIFPVVPSDALRPVMRGLAPHLDADQTLIHGIKGIEPTTFKRMSQILLAETRITKIGVLSGPNLAKEVALKQPSAAVVASTLDEVVQTGRRLLSCRSFRVYGSRDLVGVEVAGAVKNVLAIASGLAQGLGFGMNTMALLVTRGLAEIARLGIVLGASRETFQGLAGVGDLMVTCFSPLSRNYQVGFRLARGETLEQIQGALGQVAEGVKTTRTVRALAQGLGVYMPITAGVHRVLFDAAAPATVLDELLGLARNVYELDEPH